MRVANCNKVDYSMANMKKLISELKRLKRLKYIVDFSVDVDEFETGRYNLAVSMWYN